MKLYYQALFRRQTERRIQDLLPVFAFQGDNFSANTPDIRVDVERLPEMINRTKTRYDTDVQKGAKVRLKNRSKRVEETVVRIYHMFFLLQAKQYLHGGNSFLRAFNLV